MKKKIGKEEMYQDKVFGDTDLREGRGQQRGCTCNYVQEKNKHIHYHKGWFSLVLLNTHLISLVPAAVSLFRHS